VQGRCPRAGSGRMQCGVAALATMLLAGCEVGPDFLRPDPPEANAYTPSPLVQTASAATEGGAAQRFDPNLDIPGQWWALFHSKPLNDLVERALAANPDLQAAQSALRVAEENVRAGEGAFAAKGSGTALLSLRIRGPCEYGRARNRCDQKLHLTSPWLSAVLNVRFVSPFPALKLNRENVRPLPFNNARLARLLARARVAERSASSGRSPSWAW